MPPMSSLDPSPLPIDADVVIVGAGAAGCAAAGRLARAGLRVLLLEAGGPARSPLFRVPMATGILAYSGRAAWQDETEPEPGTAGRRIRWPHGRVIGGSTAINGMVWMRGRPSDYDGWAAAPGMADWRWDEVRPVFAALEGSLGAAERGAATLPVQVNSMDNPLVTAFVDAAGQAGYPASAHVNAAPHEGVGRFLSTAVGGRRWSSAQLLSGAPRDRLVVMTGTVVEQIRIETGRISGVIVRRGGKRFVIDARRVVLCAGAVDSPRLLTLSGIGDARDLARLSIPLVRHLPGVGRNLQDHYCARVAHASLRPVSLARLARVDRAAFAFSRAWLGRCGPAAVSPFAAGFLLKSDDRLPETDIEGVFFPTLVTVRVRAPFSKGGAGHGFGCSVYPLRPASRGYLQLESPDPLVRPRIHPCYLSAPEDLEKTRAGIAIIRRLFAQRAFDGLRGEELDPGPLQDTAAVDDWIARSGVSAFHPVGTCKMGDSTDPAAVVDPRLRVHGVKGLSVADASVMPRITSGNTAAPSIMIGHRCADFLLAEMSS